MTVPYFSPLFSVFRYNDTVRVTEAVVSVTSSSKREVAGSNPAVIGYDVAQRQSSKIRALIFSVTFIKYDAQCFECVFMQSDPVKVTFSEGGMQYGKHRYKSCPEDKEG